MFGVPIEQVHRRE